MCILERHGKEAHEKRSSVLETDELIVYLNPSYSASFSVNGCLTVV